MKQANKYSRYRFPPEVISTAVWLYHLFSLSFRDVDDLMAQRGVVVSYESVPCWCLKFGAMYPRALKRREAKGADRCHIDEVFVKSTASTSTYGAQLIKTVTYWTSWSRVAETE